MTDAGVTAPPGIRIAGSVDEVPATAWDALAGEEELYVSTPWMRVLEETSGAAMRYLLAYRGERLVGGLPAAQADASAPWLSGRPDTLLQRCVREQRPGAGEAASALAGGTAAALLPGTVCGGRHLGRNRVVATSAGVVERLVSEAERLARDRGDRSVSFLYVDEHDRILRDVLAGRGYAHYSAARYSWLELPREGFDGYLAARSAHRRRRIARERRVLREAGVLVDVEPLHADLIPRMAELETRLLHRYGSDWSPRLSERIFSAIAAGLGQAAFVCAARREGRLTGFTLFVARGAGPTSTWYAHRAGFDYDANGDLPVYFEVTYYRPVEVAARLGVARIHYGTGSDEAKASRGCVSTTQHAYTLRLRGTATAASPRRRARQVDVRPLDVYDQQALDGLHQLMAAVRLADLPERPPPCRLDVTGGARFPWPGRTQADLLAWEADQVVGAVRAVRRGHRPQEAHLEYLLVSPAHRRAGIASALLRAVWDRWPELLVVTGDAPRRGDGDPGRDPAPERFARSQGATEATRFVHLRLAPLPAREDLEARVGEALAALPDYALRHWGSAVPEPLRAGVAELLGVTGSCCGTEHCRAHLGGMERMRAGRQRRCWDSAVWHVASGELVAWSSLTMAHTVRDHATQGMTVVNPPYRGQGLATLVKLANMLHATTHEPALAVIDAVNAATNTAMVRTNLKLGYRQVGESVTWRLERATP